MKITIALSLFLTSLVITTNASAQAKPFQYGDTKRRYIVYVPPSYDLKKDKAFPLVLNFHGGGMTMAEQMLYTQMNKTADKHEFIVVYPQGINQDWNVGFDMPYRGGTDDVGFVDSLLTTLGKDLRIDPSRVYATGLSRGGFFCHRLAKELAHRFAAIAPVGAPMPEPVLEHSKETKTPVSAMIVQGSADEIVKHLGKKGGYLSAAETFQYWKTQNDLAGSKDTLKTIDKTKSDGTSVLITSSAHNSRYVSLVTINNGGHTWAGADPFNMGLRIGKTSRDINLNELIWEFFAKNRK